MTAFVRAMLLIWEPHVTFQSVQTTVHFQMDAAIVKDIAAFAKKSLRAQTASRKHRTAIGRRLTLIRAFFHHREVLRMVALHMAIQCSSLEVTYFNIFAQE